MLSALLLMATTIVSNIAVFSDQTGHGNQSHLVYAAVQQRWWLFYFDSKTATTVKTQVSSSNDLTTATWSAGTASPAFPNSHALSSNDQRNLGVVFVPNSINANDAVHVSVGIGTSTNSTGDMEHVRATFTGSNSITWGSWVETADGSTTWTAIKGNALGVATDGSIHNGAVTLDINGNSNYRKASNVDTGSAWTNAWGANAQSDTVSNLCNVYALAPLASAAMLAVYDDGGAADPNNTGLRWNKYTSGTTWPTTGGAAIGFSTTQDQNDWCICAVDTTHVFAARPKTSTVIDWRLFNGTSWTTKTSPAAQARLAGSGLFAATDGTNVWLFLLDSASNNPVQYNKYTVGSDTWGGWTQLEAAGSTARNYISGYPAVSNSQIGVIYTAVNGSNFDLVLSVLNLAGGFSPSSGFPWPMPEPYPIRYERGAVPY